MRMLFDQNISYRILHLLSAHFPGSQQVRQAGLENKTDMEIWNYARENNFALVTFDADFSDIANLYGHPPKIIWLRTGNRTTASLAALMVSKKELIKDFLENEKYNELSCLVIDC